MKRYVTCLTIAGSDSGGGAGIQADIKTMSAIGVYATSVITAVTSQNTISVNNIYPIPPNIVASQINSVFEDINCNAVKIGMVYSPEVAKEIAKQLGKHSVKNIVLDPVLISTTNYKLNKRSCCDAIKKYLIPISLIVTPNADESYKLTGIKTDCREKMRLAARELIKMGANSVLIKGGHVINNKYSADYLLTKEGKECWYKSKAIETRNTHGTGCTLSSAIASYLALGYEVTEAVSKAKRYITNAIKEGKEVTTGKGYGPVNHFYSPKKIVIKYED